MIHSREFYIMRAQMLAANALSARKDGQWAEAHWCLAEQQRVFKVMEFLRKE